MKNTKRRIFAILISVLIIQMSIAMPLIANITFAKNGVVIGSPPTITVSNSSQSVHVEHEADYTVTVKNNCDNSDYINIELSGVDTGWSAELFESDDSTPLSDHNNDGKPDTGLLSPGESYTFHLRVTPGDVLCNNVQDTITITATPASGNCNAATQDVTTTAINTGILEITKTVSPTEVKVGEAVTWTIHIKNTGNDPLGNVVIQDDLGAGCSYNNDIDFHGNNPSSGGYPNWTYTHLPAGADYEITFSSKIIWCANADNTLHAKWGISGSECQDLQVVAPVKIIIATPHISFNVSDISVPYCGSTDVDIPITNSGDGVAKDFKLKIDKIPDFYTISNIGSDWSYDSNTGEFTYTGGTPSGTIDANSTVHLTFTVSMPNGACSGNGSATLKYTTTYTDPCGNPFYDPSTINYISVSGSGPHFEVSKTGPDSVDVGETGLTYTISVTYHKGDCSDDSKTVNIADTLPDPFIPKSADNGGTINGQTVEWDNVTLQDGQTQTFHITFDVTTDSCYAHDEYTNTVNLSGGATDCCGCDIPGASASFSTYINDPASTIRNSSKDVDNPTVEVDCSTDTNSYTNPSGNPDSHNNRRYTTEYDFVTSDVYAPTSWNNTDGNGGHIVFYDELQNNQYTNPDIANVDVEVNCNGSWINATQYAAITYPQNSGDPLKIDLGGLQNHVCPPSSGARLKISYTVRATQTDNSNNDAVSHGYVDWSRLEVPGFPRGCSSDPDYDQGIRVTDERAELGLSLNPLNIVKKCHTYPVTISLSKENGNLNVDAADLTVNLEGFEYIPNSTTYSNNGNWCSGTKGEPTVNGNTLTWSSDQLNEITGNGYITIQVKKRCDSGYAAIQASSNYKDNCGKTHSASATSSAILVQSAKLYAKITPQLNWGGTHTVDWKAYFTNGGDSEANEVVLHTKIGSGLAFNKDGAYIQIGSNTYNYGDAAITWPSDGANGDLEWKLNNLTIAPSQKILLYFKTDVNDCDENNLTVETYARWCVSCIDENTCGGCGESNHDNGQVLLPTPYALVTIGSASFSMCSGGSAQITISDPGQTDLYNAAVIVDLPKYIKYESNSAQYTFNNGSAQSAGDPDITSITSGNYSGGYELKWDYNKISELSDLAPGDEIVLTFNILPDDSQTNPSCEFFKNGYQKIKSHLEFAKPCDVDDVNENSVENETNIDLKHANLLVVKKVVSINGSSSYNSNWHYFPKELGANVTFEVDITNNGDLDTVKTDVADVLKGANQHPLDYVSAQYSYDGGSWTSVPWDSADSTNGIFVWNDVEADLGSGIAPGKTLKIQITATVDSTCTDYKAYNYSEVWTGCDALPDIASNGSNLKGSATTVSYWNGTLNADCPICQALYARNRSHYSSWDMHYSQTVPANVDTCDTSVQYEIVFSNGELKKGAATIYGPLEIYDLIPVGTTYVANSAVVTLPDNSTQQIEPTSGTETVNGTDYTKLTWTLNSSVNLAPGDTVKVDFKLDFGNCSEVDANAVNRQRLLGYDCSGNSQHAYPSNSHWPGTVSNSWVAQTHVRKSNVSINITADKQNVSPGDSILYMIHVKNTGDGAAKHFTITDVLPSGLIVDSSSITDGPPPGWGTAYPWMSHNFDSNTNTITWQSTDSSNDNAFPAGAETTVSFRVFVGSGATSPIENHATFTDNCCNAPGTESNTVSTKITATPIKVTKEIVEVNGNSAVNPVKLQPGDIVTYRIKVENKGSLDIYNTDVFDTLPAGFEIVNNTSEYALTNGSVPSQWTSTSDPSASSTPSGSSGVKWDLNATIQATDDDGGASGANQDTLFVQFNAKVTTSAPGSASGVLAPNKAEISATTDSAGNDLVESDAIDTSDAEADALVYKPELIINKSVVSINGNTSNTTQVQPGDTVRYKITVKNTSEVADALSVNVADTLPSGFTYVSGSTSANWSGGSSTADPSVSGQNLSFNYDAEIDAGDMLVIEFTAKVSSSGALGKNTNTASASGTDRDSGSVSATGPDGSGSAQASVDVYKPVLSIEKISDVDTVPVGTAVTFTIKVENHDSYAEAHNINITDALPSGWNYVSGSSFLVKNNGAMPSNWGSAISDPSGTTTLNWNLSETLLPTDDQATASGSANDTLWLKFQATPSDSALGCANKDTATVSYTDKNGTALDDVSESANVCVCSPKLEMTKSADKTQVETNEEVTFTLKVDNKNPVDAHSVNVHDFMPQGWIYIAGSGEYALTNGSTPTSWTSKEPVVEDTTLLWDTLNATVQGTDDNGGATGSANDTLWVRFKAKGGPDALYGINVNRAIAEGRDAANNYIGTNEGKAFVTVNKPVIYITKTVDLQTANVGDTLTYTITVTNSGNEDLVSGTITDTLPDGVIWQSGGLFSAPNTVTFANITVPANGNIQETVTVKINKNVSNGAVLENSAKVSGEDLSGNTFNAGLATAQTTVHAPILTIVKSSTPNPVRAGENITYTITVTNSGEQDATNVVITDDIPQYTIFVSADNGGTVNSNTVSWNVGTVSAGSSVTVHFTVKVDSPINDNTIIQNSATVDSDQMGSVNSDVVQNVVSSVPQLNICKTDSQDPVKAGNEFTYTIRYANNSTMDITNVIITETYPSDVTFVSATPAPDSGTNNVWSIGNLPAGSSGNITITVKVNDNTAAGTILHNTVIGTSNETPQASASEDTTVGTLPALTISKSDNTDPVEAGTDVIYTIKFANTGSEDATNVVITDDYTNLLNLPLNPSGTADATLVSHSESGPVSFAFTNDTTNHKWVWTASGLPGNSSGTITVKVHVPNNVVNGTVLHDIATIASDQTNPATDSENTTVHSAPVLNLTKDASANPDPAEAGGSITYTLNYSNTGNENATSTVLTDKIPQNTAFVVGSVSAESGVSISYSNDNGSTWNYTPVADSNGTDPNVTDIRFDIGTLQTGGTNHAASFEVKIANPLDNGTVIRNTAHITCAEGVSNDAEKDVTIGSAPSLHITKTAPSSAQAGNNITYTIEYWNDGNMNATGVVITESYDENTTFVSATPAPDSGTNNVWSIGTVANDGQRHTITITVQIKSPTPNGTVITNAVTIDSDQTNTQQATAQTTVGSAPTLTLTKASSQSTVDAGDNIVYTITAGNIGNADATTVVITDVVPAHTTFVSARFISKSGTIDASSQGGTGTVKWTLSGALAPSEEFAVELIVKVDVPTDNNTVVHNEAKVVCAEDQQGVTATKDVTVHSAPVLTIDKKDLTDPVQAGDNITYQITVSNTGNMNAHNVVITDTVPANTTFVSASFVSGATGMITDPGAGNTGDVQWTLSGTLDVGNSAVVQLVVKTNSPLPNGTTIDNTASVRSDEVSPVSDSETTTVGSGPKLEITKTDSPDPVQAGDNITYTITVTNTGNMNATEFVITDTVPANTTFVSASFVSGATGTINAPPVGGSGTVTYTPNPDVLEEGHTVVVQLVVKTAGSLPDGTVITNTAYADSAEVQRVPAIQETTVGGKPILQIDKAVYPQYGAPGKLMIYAINYRNVGNAPATNVAITESYQSDVSFYFANPQPSSGNNTWTIPVLNAGESGSITVIVKINDDTPLGTIVHNTVTINSIETDPVSASAEFEVKAPKFWDPEHVYQRKVVSPEGTVAPGTWLTYVNYYGNAGNLDATNVKITDTLDTNLDENSLIIYNGGTYDPASRTITWIIPVVHPGETGHVSFKVRVRTTVGGSTPIANTTYISSDQTPEPVATNTVYNTIFAPCPPPQPKPKPEKPNPINITINPPEKICIGSQSKFVFTFTGGVPPYNYTVNFGDGTNVVAGKESGKFTTLMHTYTKEGVYTVEISVKDKKGTTSNLSRQVKAMNCKVVLDVYHQNFIIGYPDGMFNPGRTVTRAEVATMLIRALGFDAAKVSGSLLPFKDVSKSSWYFNFIEKAYEEKLMFGSGKQFNPNKPATRAEIATILVRMRGLKPETPQEELFTDVKPSDWFNGFVYTAVKAGLLQGYKDHTFRPNNKVSRAEFVTMLDRALYREDVPQVGALSLVRSPFPDVKKDYWAYRYIIEAAVPHIVTNAIRAPINITTTSKAIPVYLASTKSKIIFPTVSSTVAAIVPVDGMINGKDPSKRKLNVRIINKGTP